MKSAIEPWIPLVNISLIVISGVFLLLGYAFIRQKRVLPHKRCMLTATVFAALSLVVAGSSTIRCTICRSARRYTSPGRGMLTSIGGGSQLSAV